MRKILPVFSALAVLFAVHCGTKQQGQNVSLELADKLTDSIAFEGGTEVKGTRPAEHGGDPAYPQVIQLDAPSTISPGQSFQLTLYTDYDGAQGEVTGAIIAVEKNGVQASGYVDVLSTLETWGRRSSMRIFGRLDKSVAGTTEAFVMKIAMHREDGKVGNYYEWNLTVGAGSAADGGIFDAGGGQDASVDAGGMEWIKVEAGTFPMGCSQGDTNCYDSEREQHQVVMGKSFWLTAYEVTQGQYKAVTGENPSFYSDCGGDCPVDGVSWEEAAIFCKRIGGRLPTEAEWEYTARAGTTTELYTGRMTVLGQMDSPELDPISWYGGNSGVSYENGLDCSDWNEKQYESLKCGPHGFGLKQRNGLGFYDMLGNVWEWVEDDWHENYQGAPADGSAWVDSPRAEKRVLRGGAWDSSAINVRVSVRGGFEAEGRYDDFGFRCAKD